MKVLFIVPYPLNSAPSQRLKFEQYLVYFQKAGIECIIRPFMSKKFYSMVYKERNYLKKIAYTLSGYLKRLFNIYDIFASDLVYLHLEATPFGPPFFEYLCKFFNKPIIYDIDDIVFLPNYSAANRLVRFFDNPKKIFKIFRISSQIIVVTTYLRDCAMQFNKNVVIIPPTINTDKYLVKNYDHKVRRICVGWSGSKTTSVYLRLLEGVLKQLSEKYEIKIKVIGDAAFKIPGLLNISASDWRLDSEVSDLQEIDIGLYPLPKTEWVLGKGGLKALQYMGIGIPVVCSRIGACTEFIKDEENGFLVDSQEEWLEKISQLIENHDLRKKIGLAGRATVEKYYSLKANTAKYLEVIKQTYNNRYFK